MQDAMLEAIKEITQTMKEHSESQKEFSICQREISDNNTKQTIDFNRSMVTTFIILAIALVLSNLIWASCHFYSIYQQYNYEGYPSTSIENTNIGGEFNAEKTETPKAAETVKLTKEVN